MRSPPRSLLTPIPADDGVTGALLALLRRGPGPEAAELAALREDDWTRLVRRAKVHRVAPLIFRRLVTAGLTSAVPASALEFLRDESLRNSLHNMKIFKALGEILEALNAKGIPVILLKGVHLAEFYYPDRTLRPMVDIDIMVKFSDYDEAATALLKAGYAFRYPEAPENLHIRHPRDVPMTNEQGLTVELHRTFEPRQRPPRIDMDPVWDRAQPLTVDGHHCALGLAPEDLLLHLCMHMASQDCFATGLIALSDVCHVVESMNGEFPWERFMERAEQWGSSKGAYFVSLLATELLGMEPPERLLPALRPVEVTIDLEDEVRSLALAGNEAAIQEPIPLLLIAASLPPLQKLRILLGRVFVSRDVLSRLYRTPNEAPMIYSYYLLRFKDLIRRHLKTAFRLARRDSRLAQVGEAAARRECLRTWILNG